jgi:hypothetical protein
MAFNLPAAVLLLSEAFKHNMIDPSVFVYTGPIVVAGLLGAIPLLFCLG